MNCAAAIFKCADDEDVRRLVREYGGVRPLKELLEVPAYHDNRPLMAALTGAVWKCAISPENVEVLRELNCVSLLIALSSAQSEEVLVNIMGALAEMAKDQQSRTNIRKVNGIQAMIELLSK